MPPLNVLRRTQEHSQSPTYTSGLTVNPLLEGGKLYIVTITLLQQYLLSSLVVFYAVWLQVNHAMLL